MTKAKDADQKDEVQDSAKEQEVTVYTGTKMGKSDVRAVGKVRWARENNWTVPVADVPVETMKEIREGSLKGEFKITEEAVNE